MSKTGRKESPMWDYFNKVRKKNNKGPWAVCKKCSTGLQGMIDRLGSTSISGNVNLLKQSNKKRKGQEVSAKTTLAGKWVTLSLDGWTNVNNESLVCIAATTTNGDAY